MRDLLVGYGRMGGSSSAWRASTTARSPASSTPAGRRRPAPSRWRDVDVAIDFSPPDAVAGERAGAGRARHQRGHRHDRLARARGGAARGRSRTPASASSPRANFSTGVVLFEAIVAHAAALFAAQPDFGAWIHEAHHAAKKDAPSGTALMLKRAMEQAGSRADRRRRRRAPATSRARTRSGSTARPRRSR